MGDSPVTIGKSKKTAETGGIVEKTLQPWRFIIGGDPGSPTFSSSLRWHKPERSPPTPAEDQHELQQTWYLIKESDIEPGKILESGV